MIDEGSVNMNQIMKEKLFTQTEDFYNKDRKIAFIKYYEENFNLDYSAIKIISVFGFSTRWERTFKKDVCDFSVVEYKSLFANAGWYKAKYFTSIRLLIRHYSEWCKENGYTDKIDLEIVHLERSMILDRIIGSVFPFRNQNDFLDFYDNVFQVNDPDYRNMNMMRYCSVLLAWDGLNKSEIFNLTKEDVVDGKAFLAQKNDCDKRELTLSNKTLEVINCCNHMTNIKVKNKAGQFSEFNLNNGHQVIRAVDKGRGTANVQSIITNYTKIIRKIVNESAIGKTMPYEFSYQNVMYNGILVRAVETNDFSEVNYYKLENDLKAFVDYYNF